MTIVNIKLTFYAYNNDYKHYWVVKRLISYEPFWRTLKEKGVTTYTLINKYGINSRTINNLKHNKSITMYTLERLCNILNCQAEDIVHFVPDEWKNANEKAVKTVLDYSPLWETMQRKNISQHRLLKAGIDNKTLDTLKKRNNITLLTLEKICTILECTPNEVVQFIKE